MHLRDELRLLIKGFFLSSFASKHHPRSYGSTIDHQASKIWCNFQTTSYHFQVFETNDLLCRHRAKHWQYSISFTSKWCSRHCCETIKGLYSKISAYLLRQISAYLLWLLTVIPTDGANLQCKDSEWNCFIQTSARRQRWNNDTLLFPTSLIIPKGIMKLFANNNIWV